MCKWHKKNDTVGVSSLRPSATLCVAFLVDRWESSLVANYFKFNHINFMKKIIIIGISLIILSVIVVGFVKKQNSIVSMPIKQVTIEIVSAGSANQENVFGSLVRNTDEAIVSAQVGGNISHVYVSEGDLVKKGQTLVSISVPEIAAQYAQADTQLKIAQEQEKRARRNWDDYKPEEREQFKLYTQQANAARTEAGAFLAKTNITAPFDGIVSKKFIQNGVTVMPGAQIVYIVGDTQHKEVVVDVPAAIGETVAIGDNVTVTNGTYDAQAIVTALSPVSDQVSRKIAVRATLANDAPFTLGEFVDLNIISSNKLSGIDVPKAAIVKQYNDTFLFVVTDDIAYIKNVQIVGDNGDDVVVEGISVGDAVVISGAHDITDGEIISVMSE